MGITTDDFFENLYNIIFAPQEFFKKTGFEISARLGALTVALTAFIVKLTEMVFKGKATGFFFIPKLIFFVCFALAVWALAGLFFEYTAKIFDRNGNYAKVLYFTAFATVPYIFFPPLEILKASCDIGFMVASIVEFVIYLRIIFLYAYGIKTAYEITYSRAFMFLFLPLISSFFMIYWTICIIEKTGYIFSLW